MSGSGNTEFRGSWRGADKYAGNRRTNESESPSAYPLDLVDGGDVRIGEVRSNKGFIRAGRDRSDQGSIRGAAETILNPTWAQLSSPATPLEESLCSQAKEQYGLVGIMQ